jgi:hypothetical protein
MMPLSYRWLAAPFLALALVGWGYFKGRSDEAKAQEAATLEFTQEARRLERQQSFRLQEILDGKDIALRRINARLSDSLERLRDRPDRLPEPTRAACEGATGSELSGRDAAFLERLAARADAVREELKACQDREHSTPPVE